MHRQAITAFACSQSRVSSLILSEQLRSTTFNLLLARIDNPFITSQMISAQAARRAVWRPLWELPGRLDLIFSLARREFAARYKGSLLGIVWAVVTPIVTIA